VLRSEARWIAAALLKYPVDALSPLINLGSGTLAFRARTQPYIQREVFGPLVRRGVAVVHVDADDGDGVDIVGDVVAPSTVAAISALQPRTIVCANLFEHILDRELLADSITRMSVPTTLLVLTVPRQYPYHPSPIDTGFRPTPSEVARLFPEASVLQSDVVREGPLLVEYVAALVAKLRLPDLSSPRTTAERTGGSGVPGERRRVLSSRLRHLPLTSKVTCVLARLAADPTGPTVPV
jgi:hypothetical protein